MSDTRHRTAAEIWRWPTVLAILTICGLLSALLGQWGIWLVLSWIALASPLLLIVRYGLAQRRLP
jgi:uncharacterized membrane protein YjjP (DUF1212 family)